MDNNTQNPVADTTQAVNPLVQDPVIQPVQPTPAPVDPMDNAQVPDLPQAPVQDRTASAPVAPAADPAPVQPAPQPDPSAAMQQMANTTPPPDAAPIAPVQPDPVQQPQPQADGPLAQAADPAPAPSADMSLGPVTMEDLMEELQHIEDKLDEMDEKL